jgi:hypothetical protein
VYAIMHIVRILHNECTVDFSYYLYIYVSWYHTFTQVYYNIFSYFLLLYHTFVYDPSNNIYVLDIYWNDIDALIPCGTSHGLLSKASGHGSINTLNTLHFASKNNKTIIIIKKKKGFKYESIIFSTIFTYFDTFGSSSLLP